MQINRSPKKQPTIQSPSKILSKAKIKTFKELDRRGSIFNLIKDAKSLKNNILELEEENSNTSSSELSKIESDSSIPLSVKKYKANLQTLNKDNTTHKHKYKENMLPILTTSNQILTEIDFVNDREEYYKRNLSNSNNFGRKFARRNLTFKSFETKNEEEFIQLIGLNDEEKDPLEVIQGKKIDMNIKNKKNEKINISNINTNNFNFLLLKAAKQRIENKKFIAQSKLSRKSVDLKHILLKYKEEISKKKEKIFSFYKKDEFADFLIVNYIKEKYPKLMNSSDKFRNNMSKDSDKNNNNNIIQKRRIFVIKNSTIIYNSKAIPGFLLEIPTSKEMNKYSNKKRKIIMSQFYSFITKKFQSNNQLNIIFKSNRNIIQDFGYLSKNDKYIYVSNKSIFEGLLFPLNKNLIHTYFQHFQEKEVDKFYFNESSFDSKSYSEEDEHIIKNKEDIYDIFFSKKISHKNFKKIKKSKKNKKLNLNSSFTFGIDSEENENNYEYIYYSDSEKRRKNFEQNEIYIFQKNVNDNINFYIHAQNQIFDKKIDSLLSQLSSNKARKNFYNLKKKYNKASDELIKDYLIEKNMPNKNILKQDIPKKLTYRAVIDSFNLLRTKDKTIDINKFVKARKGEPLYLPKVDKNKKDNSSKYYFSRAKLDKEYPSTLSYNFPKVVEKEKKYTLTDLVKYYTKFKSLLNLWLNMHPFADVAQYGIDFDTFFSCTEDICEEEEVFARKIFNKINMGPTGILSLEDYVVGLIALNSDVLTDQIEFFLKVFNSRDKTYFNYKEIFEISKLSIKRLIKIKNKIVVDTVSDDLGGYLADFIFKICESKKEKGIEIKKLKNVLENDKENGEFIKLFMCFFGDNKIESNVKNIIQQANIDKDRYIKKYRESIRLSFVNHLNN